MFGTSCCTLIPNNIASDGSLTKALSKLRTMSEELKEHSGVDTSIWSNILSMFGRYRTLILSFMMTVAVFTAILVVCGCCCVTCLRFLCTRLVVHTIEGRPSEFRALLLQEDELDEEYQPDLYPMSHYGQETDNDCV